MKKEVLGEIPTTTAHSNNDPKNINGKKIFDL
jgi:hypothetical protein